MSYSHCSRGLSWLDTVAYAGFFKGGVSVTSHRDDVSFSDVTASIMPQRRKQSRYFIHTFAWFFALDSGAKRFHKNSSCQLVVKNFPKNFSRLHFWAIGRLTD